MKIDKTNLDPVYWEKILAVQKLELLEPENEEFESTPSETESNHARKVRDGNRDMEKLYEKFDGKEGFFTGHQVSKVGKVKQQSVRDRRVDVPDWANNNKKVQKILLTAFPKLQTSSIQRKRAARWASVIHLYYRMGFSRSRVAEELQETPIAIKFVLRNIRMVAEGKRSDTGETRSK